MSEAFIGEIRLFAGNYEPQDWALCNGQLLSIQQNQVLFTLLGTTYGGDGRNSFALPDLRGRAAIGAGQAPGRTPQAVNRLGLARSFQISAVFPHLTVLENVRIGLQRPLGNSFHFWKSEKKLSVLNDKAMELLSLVDLDDFADTMTVDLPYGRKRALEIATTLGMEPALMLLDEPTQGMGHEDVDRVTQLIKKVSAGRTILMVEHNMNVVAGICDRISVLQRGAVLAEGSYEEVSRNPEVMEAYMGSSTGVLEGAH